MTPEQVCAEIKKVLVCPDNHKIELFDASYDYETTKTTDSNNGGDENDGGDWNNPNNIVVTRVVMYTLKHWHIAVDRSTPESIAKGRQICGLIIPVSEYTYKILTTNINPTERGYLIKEFAHAIVTQGLNNNLSEEDNHIEFQEKEYPHVR